MTGVVLVLGPITAGVAPFLVAGLIAVVLVGLWAYFSGWAGPNRK